MAKSNPQIINKSGLKMRRPRLTARINLNRFWHSLEESYMAKRTSSKLVILPDLQDTDIEEQNRINEELERKMAAAA